MRQISAVIKAMLTELLRKKDIYVLFILMGVFFSWLSAQTFFDIDNISRYLIDLGYSVAVFFSVVIAVLASSKQMPAEINSRSIYPLLAKPISRNRVIISKFLGSFIVSSVSFSLFYFIFVIFYLRSGDGVSYLLALQSYIMGIMLMSIVVSVCIFFSNFLTFSACVTLSLLMYIMIVNFAETTRNALLASEGFLSLISSVLYFLVPHYEFYDMRVRLVHAWSEIPFWVLGAVLLYTVFYTALMVIFSGVLFKRREL